MLKNAVNSALPSMLPKRRTAAVHQLLNSRLQNRVKKRKVPAASVGVCDTKRTAYTVTAGIVIGPGHGCATHQGQVGYIAVAWIAVDVPDDMAGWYWAVRLCPHMMGQYVPLAGNTNIQSYAAV